MTKQYYTLVAGLADISPEGGGKGFSARDIIDDIRAELSSTDRKYLDLFYNYYDVENIISIRNGRGRFSELGVFSREELEKKIAKPKRLPEYIKRVFAFFDDPDNVDYEDEEELGEKFEHALLDSYYRECSRSRCRFVREWGEFDRNLRNLTAAYTARNKTIPMSDVVVGRGYVVDHLTRNSALDFGLKGELGYIDTVINAISEEPNLVEKEKKIDNLRWEMSDELTTFDYFNINTILAFLVKVNIIHRWQSLDLEQGKQMLERLIGSLSAKDLMEEAEKRVI